MNRMEHDYILILVSIDDLSRENRVRIVKALRRHLRLDLHTSLQIMETLDQLPGVVRTGYGPITWQESERKLRPLMEELSSYGVVTKMNFDDGSQD